MDAIYKHPLQYGYPMKGGAKVTTLNEFQQQYELTSFICKLDQIIGRVQSTLRHPIYICMYTI